MSDVAAQRAGLKFDASALFPIAILISATLVFLLQPIVARLILPLLGGSPAVWTTSMAFFQAALLGGYAYAHLLQRVRSLRLQMIIHGVVLVVAALALPLRVSSGFGEPDVERPILWLLATLVMSVGAPFAALSATAPLVQAWYARTRPREQADQTYRLYAASNIGSLVALLGYPLAVEPLLSLSGQRWIWTVGYGLFVAVLGALALIVSGRGGAALEATTEAGEVGPRPSWRRRGVWVVLAAIPSSLMLGVTSHLTTDVASAPMFWVLPLALYLLTFILAFSDRRILAPDRILMLQVGAAALSLAMLYYTSDSFVLVFLVQLSAFFLAALACHTRLYDLRPDTTHLTEFYLCLSLGGVIGGGFNAFLAPVLFTTVIEYPLVIVLSALALAPASAVDRRALAIWLVAVVLIAGAPLVAYQIGYSDAGLLAMRLCLLTAVPAAILLRRFRILLVSLLAILASCAYLVSDHAQGGAVWRNFFGVVTISDLEDDALKADVRTMTHGTTLHGAQSRDPVTACQPMVYYTPATPIGQVFTTVQARKPAVRVATTGLGAGSVAAFVRPNDRMTFFEIDPLVVELASDPYYFTYTTECAKGSVDYVVGDARLTLAKQPDAAYDIVFFDAFSSDAVPTHLLTREAIQLYLSKTKPDGVIILHLSNRNLQLRDVAMASAVAAGGHVLLQRHAPTEEAEERWESASDVVIVGKTPEALADFRADPRWIAGGGGGARPWTDDYSNLVGPIISQMLEGLGLASDR